MEVQIGGWILYYRKNETAIYEKVGYHETEETEMINRRMEHCGEALS